MPCYNEAQNIRRLLDQLCETWPRGGGPARVVVVSDASTDGTDEIVAQVARRAPIDIELIVSSERRGKSAAVNRIIEQLDDVDVIVLISADVLPVGDCLARLLAPFERDDVGVAGGRPVAEGPADNAAVRVSQLLWELHHHIALHQPKSTEITAFRNLHQRIDEASLVDEAEIERSVTQASYRVVYVPEARIRTMSPLTLRDYVRQRVRVTVGHLALAHDKGYRVGTLSMRARLAALRSVRQAGRLRLDTLLLAAALESAVYGVAQVVRRMGKMPPRTWSRIESAKRPLETEHRQR